MDFVYETEHLHMKTLLESDSLLLLDFCQRNLEHFKPFEPEYPDNYLTEEYQKLLINGFSQQFLKLRSARYYLFEKGHDDRIIGCVGLSEIHLGDERCAKLFYKIDRAYCGKGYAAEASAKLLEEAVNSIKLHRVEADILPDNIYSINVVKKLGFEYEGIAKLSHKANGVWADHARYAKIL